MARIFFFIFTVLFLPAASVEFTLEHAVTDEQIAWGLMGRRELPENHGMSFTMPRKRRIQVWMFNCYVDLSVAFLDENRTILEIRDLKSFPDKMDPARPVNHLADLAKYPAKDPVRQFYLKNAVTSFRPAKYFVEMPKGWFKKNGVKPGDKIVWDYDSPIAAVIESSFELPPK